MEKSLEKIVSLAKRRGFAYQTAEIYGGLNGVYDFGPLGVLLRENIKKLWMESLKATGQEVLRIDGAILGPYRMWEASGHVENFSDPMVDCTKCKRRFRADEIDLNAPCPVCGARDSWTPVRQFRLMFETSVGALASSENTAFLRPETAQSIFVNFKNVISSYRVKLPFGIAQIGKAFRNEITPRQFLFRMREFEQMEIEFFVRPEGKEDWHEKWIGWRLDFYKKLGLRSEKLRTREHGKDELAHYSSRCVDVEYEFPFGWKELEGIADRGDYDLRRHSEFSGKDLSIYDEERKEKIYPHVIESSVGVDRLFLAAISDGYREDEVEGEKRVVLSLSPAIAPVKAAVFPLVKKLSAEARKIFERLSAAGFEVRFDESGSIGKRYRRQDEIGTPVCFTVDFQSLEDGTITARDRDSTRQERIAIDHVVEYLREQISFGKV